MSNVCITICDLSVWTHIGITEEEQSNEQRLLVSCDVTLKECKACTTDDINDTTDYDAMCQNIRALGRITRCTLEKFAQDVMDELTKDVRVDRVTVEVKKYVIPGTTYISVSMHT